jgi:hypothetical protein
LIEQARLVDTNVEGNMQQVKDGAKMVTVRVDTKPAEAIP